VPSYYQYNYKLCDIGADGVLDTIRDEYAYSMKNYENAEIDTTGTGKINLLTKQENYYGRFHDDDWDAHYRNFNYTTQMLLSKNTFKYGYYEIRYRLPYTDNPDDSYGLGPNFWLYGRKGDCENAWSEIDVFEYNIHDSHLSQFQYYYSSTIHYCQNSPNCPTYVDTNHYNEHYHYPHIIDFSDGEFHTMGVKWLPNEISFYRDGIKYETYTGGYFAPSDLTDMYIFVDVNVPAFNYCSVFDTNLVVMPYVYEVDYVKVWSIERCNTDYEVCELNTSQYNNNDIYNTIVIGDGATCNTTIEQNENIQLKANKYIHLKKGFHAKQGSFFRAIITPCDSIESSTIIY
jgi:beta-glucanase (GH16 family)